MINNNDVRSVKAKSIDYQPTVNRYIVKQKDICE